MEGESPHVPLMELWGYASGTANLVDTHFEHLLFCIDCQALVNQFMELLDGLSQADPDGPSQAA